MFGKKPSTTMQSACMFCVFWKPQDSQIGWCRRYPPLPIVWPERMGETLPPRYEMRSAQPETNALDVCGEWQLAPLK